jgi:hypothetical protein
METIQVSMEMCLAETLAPVARRRLPEHDIVGASLEMEYQKRD